MQERHRRGLWYLALAALFIATFSVAIFLSLRGTEDTYPVETVAAVGMRKHEAKPGAGTTVPGQVPGANSTQPETPQEPNRPVTDDGVDRRSLALDKGPEYLPEPNEGKD